MNGDRKETKSSVPNLPLWFYQMDRNSTLRVLSRKELEMHLLGKAFRDETYLLRLREDPKGLIEEELGISLPDALHVSVLEESENAAFLVLPANPYHVPTDSEPETSRGMSNENVELLLEDQRHSLLEKPKAIEVIRRSWKDAAFLQRLMAAPKSTLEAEFHVSLPEYMEVSVVSETRDRVYIVVPCLEKLPVYEWDIPESELDNVANASFVLGTANTKGHNCPTFKCVGLIQLK